MNLDVEHGLANGSLGIVVGWDPNPKREDGGAAEGSTGGGGSKGGLGGRSGGLLLPNAFWGGRRKGSCRLLGLIVALPVRVST